MLIYVLCAIFILVPCRSLRTFNSAPTNEKMLRFFEMTSLDNSHNSADIQSKDKRDVWAILNPFHYNNNMDNDNGSEEPIGAYMPQMPKITVWEFPTERRAFINDMEIFINSNEDEDDSDEADEPQNEYVKHPHDTNYHNLDKDVIEEEKYPAFRSHKVKRETSNNYESNSKTQQNLDNENDEMIKYIHYLNEKNIVDENADAHVDMKPIQKHKYHYLDIIAQHLLRPSREKRCIEKKEITTPIKKLINENDRIADTSKGITDNMKTFYEYLSWLLDNIDSGTISDLYNTKPNVDSQDGGQEVSVNILETTDAHGLRNNNQQSAKALPKTIQTLSIPKPNAEILKNINRGVVLHPVNPDVLNALLKDMEQN